MKIKRLLAFVLTLVLGFCLVGCSDKTQNITEEGKAEVNAEKIKNIMIIGDSYSTYEGYIPDGYLSYYQTEQQHEPKLSGVDKTWWKLLADEMGYNIVHNDSYSGATICSRVSDDNVFDSSYVARFDGLIENGFFEENLVDTVFIFGGTNDSAGRVNLGEPKYSDYTPEDLKSSVPALCYLISRIREVKPGMQIVVILNTDLKERYHNGYVSVCKELSVPYVELQAIDKAAGHPTELGMEQIKDQLIDKILKKQDK